MNKPGFIRTTRVQFEKMADFLEKYPQMFPSTKASKDFDKSYKDRLWLDLSYILNAVDGPKKPPVKWRKCLKDYKCYLKKKYLAYLADTSTLSPLSYLDVRYLSMMGYMVDVEGMNYSSSDLQTIMLEEINGDIVVDVIRSHEKDQTNYHPPEIITLLPRDSNCSPMDDSENAPNKENSKSIEDTSNNKETSYNEEIQDNEETSYNEEIQDNEDSPLIDESSCNEELPYSEIPPTKKLSKKSKHKKQVKKSKNATAVALQAIAKELNMKNELTKMKIELGKEKLLLENRKIEAFELIAKRLHIRK